MDDRRRATRTTLPGQVAMLPSNMDVHVLDISVGGVLLQSTQPLNTGTHGSLRLNLWGSPFAADIEVRRVSPHIEGGAQSGYRIGAVFVAITPEHRHLIERFASQ
jgi:PilZ domain-containing protein